jgi:hypothetical protein
MTVNKPNATQSTRPCSNNAAQTITQNLERMDIASPSGAQQSHNPHTEPSPSRQSEELPSPISDRELRAEYRRRRSERIRQL